MWITTKHKAHNLDLEEPVHLLPAENASDIVGVWCLDVIEPTEPESWESPIHLILWPWAACYS